MRALFPYSLFFLVSDFVVVVKFLPRHVSIACSLVADAHAVILLFNPFLYWVKSGLEPLKAVIIALQDLQKLSEGRLDPCSTRPPTTANMAVFEDGEGNAAMQPPPEVDREAITTLASCVASLQTIFEAGLFEAGSLASIHVRNILRSRLAKLNRRGDDDRAVASWVENTFAEGMLSEDDLEDVPWRSASSPMMTAPARRSTSDEIFAEYNHRTTSLIPCESDATMHTNSGAAVRRESERPAMFTPEPVESGGWRNTNSRFSRTHSLKEKSVSPIKLSPQGKR
jgi:hypothetical protein